jgi:acyl-CoA thioester hydrolase
MDTPIHRYPMVIKEVDLGIYHHVNNAKYLTFFEEAWWDFINTNGYGLAKIEETDLGPVILEVKLRFLKELRLRDRITIETHIISYEGKALKTLQTMIRENDICCTAEFTIGLFNSKERIIVPPTPEWLKGIGLSK